MGLFITFEGIEGCGKTTQTGLLKAYLEAKGLTCLTLREPGGTLLGEKVRAILLNASEEEIDPCAELFLYEAARAQIVGRVIRPALERGLTVILDRFTDSTVAYQGYGRGIDVRSVGRLNRLASGGLKPDVTFLIDCPVETGLKRALSRIASSKRGAREDRFEREDVVFHGKVREGYLKTAKKEPRRFKVIDGGREIPLIHRDICDIINKMKV